MDPSHKLSWGLPASAYRVSLSRGERYFSRSDAFNLLDLSAPRSIALGIAFALATLVAAPQALAGVHLDHSFGSSGTVIPSLPPTWESSGFSELEVQPDAGAIVKFESIAGNSLATPAMRRYLGDGSLDSSYTSPVSPYSAAKTRLPDGKVLRAESNAGPGGDFIVRLNPDGTRDKAFGTEGASPPLPFKIWAISAGPSGAILVAGLVNKSYTGMHGNPSVILVETFVARLTADGHLDPGFAAGGVANLYSAGGIEGFPREIQEGPGDKAWLSVRSPRGENDILVGLTASGALNPDFGTGSRVNSGGTIAGFHPLADGRVQAAVNRKGKRLGRFAFTESIFLLAYRPNGLEDPGFGSGKSPAVAQGRATAVLWGADGSALLGISVTHVGVACQSFYNACFATPTLARFTSAGQSDRSFGSSGATELSSMGGPANFAGIRSLAIRPGGGYLAAGTSGLQAFLARITEEGTLDGSFGEGGLVTESARQASRNFVSAVATDPRGGIVVAGRGNADAISSFPPPGLLFRLHPNGDLDRSFAGGRAVLGLPAEVTALDVNRFGRSLVLLDESAVERVTANGRVDRSFGKGGFAFSRLDLTSVIALPNGAALVAGTDGGAATVVRLGAGGRIDRSFGTGGKASLSFGPREACTVRDLAVQANGRILLAGECGGGEGWEAMVVGRLRPNGRPDRSFAKHGRLARLPRRGKSMATAIATQRGKILIGVRLRQDKRRSELLLRLDRNGHRDRTFAHGGIARVRVPTEIELGVESCDRYEETASILPLGHRILLVRDGVGPPVLAFRQNGKRDRSVEAEPIAPDRQVAPACFRGPFATRQDGSAVIAWTKQFADPNWVVALQRLKAR